MSNASDQTTRRTVRDEHYLTIIERDGVQLDAGVPDRDGELPIEIERGDACAHIYLRRDEAHALAKYLMQCFP